MNVLRRAGWAALRVVLHPLPYQQLPGGPHYGRWRGSCANLLQHATLAQLERLFLLFKQVGKQRSTKKTGQR